MEKAEDRVDLDAQHTWRGLFAPLLLLLRQARPFCLPLADHLLPPPIVISIDGPWTAASLDLNGVLHCEIAGPSGKQRKESNPHTSLKRAIELARSLKQWQEAQAVLMPRAIVTLRYSWIFKSLVLLIS